jgi:hypothetical protein
MHSILQVRKRELGATSAVSSKNRLEFTTTLAGTYEHIVGGETPHNPLRNLFHGLNLIEHLTSSYQILLSLQQRRTFGFQAGSEPSLNSQQNDKNKYLQHSLVFDISKN